MTSDPLAILKHASQRRRAALRDPAYAGAAADWKFMNSVVGWSELQTQHREATNSPGYAHEHSCRCNAVAYFHSRERGPGDV
jgi:hypothetical protein